MTKKTINPVIVPVMETFQQVYYQTLTFAKSPDSAINGLLAMGDPGTGKSHWVKKALRDAKIQHNVEYIKGGQITAASFYVKLFQNRHSHRIMVIDDVDILGLAEVRTKIIPLLLGAVEEGSKRQVTWSTARKNQLMEEFEVPFSFDFEGKVILITNYVMEDIQQKLKSMAGAFQTRFNDVECIFTKEQKYMYTKHLIDNEDMLGKNCLVHTYAHKGKKIKGYPQSVIKDSVKFIDKNYGGFAKGVVPRIAIKIADTFMYYSGLQQKVMLKGLVR